MSAGARARIARRPGTNVQTEGREVHLHRRGVAGQFIVHDESVAAGFLEAVVVSRLVQSQAQLGAASAGRGEDPDGRGPLAGEVLVEFLSRGFGEFYEHMVTPCLYGLLYLDDAAICIDIGQ